MKPSLKKTRMKTCCIFFGLKTGSVILGCLGIIVFVLALVPHSIILQNHDFYVNNFVVEQRSDGEKDIRDSEIPDIENFSKIASAILVAYDTIFIFSSIFLIAGVSAEKRFLLIPWMVNLMLTILLVIVLLLAVIFSDQFKFSIDGQFNPNAVLSIVLVVLPLLLAIYLWFVVYTTFLQLNEKHAQKHNTKNKGNSAEKVRSGTWQPLVANNSENIAGDQTTTTSIGKDIDPETGIKSPSVDGQEVMSTGGTSSTITMCEQGHPQHRGSLSNSSFASIKGSLRVVIGGTPPPPYEAVALDIDKEEEAIKAGIHRSELMYTPVSTKDEITSFNGMDNLEQKHSSKKIQTDRIKHRPESKLALDDNDIKIANPRKGSSGSTERDASQHLLGKSLEDITATDMKATKSTSYSQLSSSSSVSSSTQAVQHATIAVLNDRPRLDISDLGFPLKNKDNNNCEVAC